MAPRKTTTKRAARKKAPEGETKAQKFVRLAERRTNSALKALRSIGKLATGAYEYSPDQVSAIMTSIKNEVIAVERRYEGKKETDSGFKLS